MSRESWVGRDARSIAEAVRSGQASARTIVEDHLARVDECNDELNALVTMCAEEARTAADALDERRLLGETLGPLAGVPFTVKDLIATAACAPLPVLALWRTTSRPSTPRPSRHSRLPVQF